MHKSTPTQVDAHSLTHSLTEKTCGHLLNIIIIIYIIIYTQTNTHTNSVTLRMLSFVGDTFTPNVTFNLNI